MSTARRVAVVTGATGELGSTTAKRLAGEGWDVAVHFGSNTAKAAEVVAACEAAGARAVAIQGDVASDADCRRIAAEVEDAFGRCDALINNAAVTKFVAAPNLDDLLAEDFQRILGVNLVGPFQMTRALTPLMKATVHANGGPPGTRASVVMVSSTAGVTGYGSSIAYAASKSALNNMTITLARVLGPEIRVNAVCPGFIQGEWLAEGMGAERYNAMKGAVESLSPLNHASDVEDQAETIVWLAGNGRHITGEAIVVDGGFRRCLARP